MLLTARNSGQKGKLMKTALKTDPVSRLALNAETASDLMTPNPVSIRDVATVREAIALLTDRGFSAAPVIDQTGKPVGVLSHSDILVHDREKIDHAVPVPEYYATSDLATRSGERLGKGFQVENCDTTEVRDIMTPVVFSVPPDASARRIIEDLVGWKVHRLFVVDDSGVLVGVISALDVLRRLG
jgi:CBS domain-containing protein